MNNTIGYFEIQADDPERAVAFYERVFGWTFVKQDMPMPYWRIQTENLPGGLMERPAAPPPAMSGTNAFVCSVEVEDYDATYAQVLASGGREALPKFAVPGRCWQGYFLDTEGNTVGLFEVDVNAA